MQRLIVDRETRIKLVGKSLFVLEPFNGDGLVAIGIASELNVVLLSDHTNLLLVRLEVRRNCWN